MYSIFVIDSPFLKNSSSPKNIISFIISPILIFLLFLPLFDTYVKGLYTYIMFVQKCFMDLKHNFQSGIPIVTSYLQGLDLDG